MFNPMWTKKVTNVTYLDSDGLKMLNETSNHIYQVLQLARVVEEVSCKTLRKTSCAEEHKWPFYVYIAER